MGHIRLGLGRVLTNNVERRQFPTGHGLEHGTQMPAAHGRHGRAPGLLKGGTQSRILSIEEEGVRFRAYTDGTERFMGPETSMEIQAALGSDIAWRAGTCPRPVRRRP